ncbi:hypothetical protein AKJ09_05891 [Labilithrix luteola]|uniref:Uncharacterized protein n=1 Tax=Labilithrix luteola TaxID=1391654 RepID=A0A0K1Q0G5_9BACT|nr:hypothetical protein AKJ09_05891 [Labilithrix luteola]
MGSNVSTTSAYLTEAYRYPAFPRDYAVWVTRPRQGRFVKRGGSAERRFRAHVARPGARLPALAAWPAGAGPHRRPAFPENPA